MRIDVYALDQERFNVEERDVPFIGPVHVITPNKAMFDWKMDELHLRSLVVRAIDGEVVSAGFPKFFNYGEQKELDAQTRGGIAQGSARFTQKVDGSLIIRSVVNGHVYLRTRGSHELGPFAERVMALINERHPKVLDPTWGQACNLLFEYTAPSNQIVIKYEQDSLTALALTAFQDDGGLYVYRFPESFAKLCEVDIVPEMPKLNSVDDVAFSLSGMDKQEGYVTWTLQPNGSYLLSKFKTAWYLKLHALRSEASPRFIKEYCVRHTLLDIERFKTQLARDGFDWEVVSYLELTYKEFEARWLEVIKQADDFVERCEERRPTPETLMEACDRKALALMLKEVAAGMGQDWLFHYGIMKYTGKEAEATDLFNAKVLDIGANEYRNLKKVWAAEVKNPYTPTTPEYLRSLNVPVEQT